ncbi:MAG: TonB-dependent receptor [Acidobacteria bacterium]|nr:TonB-dependent receptor [Acidobacteriota bacterium]
MPSFSGTLLRILPLAAILGATLAAPAAQSGNSATIRGTVTDPSSAVIPNATVTISNTVSGLNRTVQSDATGQFEVGNLPFNTYNVTASAPGFAALKQNVTVRSVVALSLNLVLHVEAAASTVTVEANSSDAIETDPTFHTDVDRDLFAKVPLESATSSLSSLVTATTPGVSADSNGQAHGLGDHASNSFSVDGQSITDQQSKTFSNQLPSNSIQSLEVIAGAPPAEYGDKTSLVIVATTRSGQGITKPTGSLYSSYGAFGTGTAGFDFSYGGKKWGNFFEIDGLNTGRFLDPPEFSVIHDKGNEANVFDRIDYSFSSSDSIHLDLNYSRSWFQNPNAYDNVSVTNVIAGGATATPAFGNVGDTDQRSKIGTYNIAPTYTRIINNDSVFNFGAFVRHDDYNYYPSSNPLADLGPPNLQTSSIAQNRTLTNAGLHTDVSYAHGVHTLKAGLQFSHTFLRENDQLGIVEATYNSPCVDASGTPLPGYTDSSQCTSGGAIANPSYLPILAPYDFTRGGSYFGYKGRADIKETSLYVQDQIKAGQWQWNIGLRGDIYNGLTSATQVEPRLGGAYTVKPTGTVLRISYARTLETPFNENLVLSSEGCANDVLAPLLSCTSGVSTAEVPGYRNEFHAGLEQALGKHFIFSGEYIWKYTHNAFDFSVLGNTPITFPIDWHNSKIPGYAMHINMPNFHNLSAYTVLSSVSARFFPPQVAGAGATVGQTGLPFRIDHDERLNQTTHVQYTFARSKNLKGLWGGFNWRYDSGQVAGAAPCYNPLSNDPNSACDETSLTYNGQPAIDLSGLTADEQFQAGLICNGQKAIPGHPLPSVCPASQFSSSLIHIPAPGTGNNDLNPPRIAPRNLFDISIGKNNLFNADRYKVDLDLTAVNVANEYALYNFLSTFSGTHYVTPRALTGKVTFNF